MQVVLDVLGFGQTLTDSIKLPRLHHQLFPNEVVVEEEFADYYREGLKGKGHVVVETSNSAVVQGIYVDSGGIQAACDPRKGGKPDGY